MHEGSPGMKPFETQSVELASETLKELKRARRYTSAGFWLAFAGFLVAVLAAYFVHGQLLELSRQTRAAQDSVKTINDQIRRDQRPWLDMTFKPMTVEVNQPLTDSIELTNSGKTPARMVRADFFIEKVRNGEQPKMEFAGPHSQFFTGTIFPGREPMPGDASRQRFAKDGKTFEEDPLTEIEWEQFQQNKIFFVIFAKVVYSDFFNVQHWTQKCNWQVIKKTQETRGTISAQKCAAYADIDDQ
jgi:hypothetical protein